MAKQSKNSSQKFIGRNRAPRVQIEYDVELYGSEQKVNLPFIMGMMSDLSGKSKVEKEKLSKRKFLEIDVDNFEDRMAAIKPRIAFQVPNTLTNEGNLNVELEFENMSDFSPANVANKVEALNKLLTARKELSNLISYMDGKDDAENLISTILKDPELLKSVMSAPKKEKETEAEVVETT